jgi:DNA-binding XRE family transcriptional regulator
LSQRLRPWKNVTANIQTVTLAGQRFVILPEADYRELVGETWEPPLPAPDAEGNCPAVESARVVLARKILRRRRAAGLTQAELARRAGVRVETLSRLEHAKHSPNVATVDKIVRTLDEAEAGQPARKAANSTGRKS